jgi:hypothetical protein
MGAKEILVHSGFLVGNATRTRPLANPKLALEDNIKWVVNILDGRAWTGLVWFGIWRAVVNTVMNVGVP